MLIADLRFVLAVALLATNGLPAAAGSVQGKAELKDTSGKSVGTVDILETPAGALFKIKASGLPPGPHAIHVHEAGVCEGDFASAGGIYNPVGAEHGFLHENGPMAGDLPNLYVPDSGSIEADMLNTFIVLSKDAEETIFSDDGASIVVFEKGDDYQTDPDGDAGSRIACGVISPAK